MHIYIYLSLLLNAFLNLQMNRSQKLSMLEKKQGQFWNLHQIPHKTSNPDFWFSSYFFYEGRFLNKNYNYFFFITEKNWNKKNRKSGFDVLLGIWCKFQNCPCFCSSIDGFWLLFRIKKKQVRTPACYATEKAATTC